MRYRDAEILWSLWQPVMGLIRLSSSHQAAALPLVPSGALVNAEQSVPEAFSETEAKPNRRIDRAPIEEAVHQAAIELREHDSGVGIEFLRKLPIGDEGNGVERPVAVCKRRGVGAVDECTKGGCV